MNWIANNVYWKSKPKGIFSFHNSSQFSVVVLVFEPPENPLSQRGWLDFTLEFCCIGNRPFHLKILPSYKATRLQVARFLSKLRNDTLIEWNQEYLAEITNKI